MGFRPQTTTVWSFPERGAWATHDGGYRGNWSPYVPRNLLLRYTRPGDLVLDPFVGGGTTAVEAALLGRRCVAGDLVPAALTATRLHLRGLPLRRPDIGAPALVRQDARALALADRSVRLVLLHPPYADAIRYSAATPGDLSHLAAGLFLDQLRRVAAESARVLAPGGRCALLIGDLRRRGAVVPLGFAAIQAFRRTGLVLEELIIKRQHHTRMEERWAPVSARRGFLLLAHEYLAVFHRVGDRPLPAAPVPQPTAFRPGEIPSGPPADTGERGRTTVWQVPAADMDARIPELARQVFGRQDGTDTVRCVRTPVGLIGDAGGLAAEAMTGWLDRVARDLPPGGLLAVETQDVRVGGELVPLGLEVCRELRERRELRLREIIAVVPTEESGTARQPADYFSITHRYLLVAAREHAI